MAWYEVGKGGILYPIYLNNNTEWDLIPPLLPSLDPWYASWFDQMCNTYTWYLDAIINSDLVMGPTLNNVETIEYGCLASIESDYICQRVITLECKKI